MEDMTLQTGTIAPVAQTPPPFKSAVEDLTPPDNEASFRAMLQEAEKTGTEEVKATLQAPQGEPVGTSPQLNPFTGKIQEVSKSQPEEVPAKFQKPDGTVDEEKLKASSKQLDEAIQNKQKSVDEILKDYKAKQKEFGDLGRKEGELKREAVSTQAPQVPITPDLLAMRQQIEADFQRDPVGTMTNLAIAIAKREAEERIKPFEQVAGRLQEQDKDQVTRSNIAAIADKDPRFLQVWGEVQKEIASDPEYYYGLKNPHKAAYSEVKERLRMGEPVMVQAQPSRSPSPILGGGTPPPVPTQQTSGQIDPRTIFDQIGKAKDISDLEKMGPEMRRMLEASMQ